MSRPTPALCLLLGFALAPWGTAAAPEGHPHAPRSQPAGATLFTALPSSATGVTAINAYDDPAMWAARYREFSLGAIGTGVGIEDLDTDGRPDLLLVTKTGGLRYYHNEGGWRFRDLTSEKGFALPAAGWYQGVAIADVDRDGRPDVYVCRFGQPNQLFMQQADGSFREEAAARGLALVDSSSQAFFADYDRDGWVDVYVQTNLLNAETRPNGQPDRLYRNNGDGRFTDVTASARIKGDTQGHSATWFDYDEDGWLDVYVANDFRDPDSLWRNQGDGSFTQELSRAVPLTPHSSMGADVGDLNNDGHLDLVVADMAATTHTKDHRGMARVRAGLPDTDAQPQTAPQYMRNAVLLNTGAGRFQEIAWMTGLEATDWTWTVRLEDFDENGFVDAYFTNGMIRELHNADLVKKMSGLESLADRIRIMQNSPVLRETHLAFANLGNLTFANRAPAWGLDQTGMSCGAATGDLDGDGDLDLVVSNVDGEFTLYRNDSAGRSLTLSLRGHDGSAAFGAVLRLATPEGIQTRTLLPERGYLSSHQPLVHFGLPRGEAGPLTVVWPSGRVQTLTGLYPGNHYVVTEDASAPAYSKPAASTWLTPLPDSSGLAVAVRDKGVNELSRQPLLTLRQNRIGPALTAADLDGDGTEDLLVGGATGDAAKLLSRLGNAFLPLGVKGVEPLAELPDAALLAFDADGDGDLDLLATKGGNAPESARATYQPRLFLNQGGATFAPAPGALPERRIVVGAAAAADFDGDGDLDVVLGARSSPGDYPLFQPSLLLRNDGGRFTDVTAEAAPGLLSSGLVSSLVWTDLNRDGRPDLVTAGEGQPVRAFLNEGGRLVDRSETLGFPGAGRGFWTSLASADVNGDGRPDLIAGNLGLNTPFSASPDQPWLTWANLREGAGRPHLLEAVRENGILYPLRGYAHLAAAFPSLASRYPTLDSFATATLDDLVPPALRGAPALAVETLHSGVFLSQGDRWNFTPLPRLAQVAPVYSWATIDLNGDGALDLIGVGNSFAPIPEVGRFAGSVGLVLQGDGRGGFHEISSLQSGLLLPGDGKGLVAMDLAGEGRVTLVASRHHDRTVAWQARAEGGAVRLMGKPGNPTALGAFVEAEWADGLRQGAEVRAGSGHFSQSSPTLFFGRRSGSLPRLLRVQWPGGATSEYAWPADGSALLSLSPP